MKRKVKTKKYLELSTIERFGKEKRCIICGKKPEHINVYCDFHYLRAEIMRLNRIVTRIFNILKKNGNI